MVVKFNIMKLQGTRIKKKRFLTKCHLEPSIKINLETKCLFVVAEFRRRYGVALAQKEWLLDSISVYDIQPLDEYAIDGSTSK